MSCWEKLRKEFEGIAPQHPLRAWRTPVAFTNNGLIENTSWDFSCSPGVVGRFRVVAEVAAANLGLPPSIDVWLDYVAADPVIERPDIGTQPDGPCVWQQPFTASSDGRSVSGHGLAMECAVIASARVCWRLELQRLELPKADRDTPRNTRLKALWTESVLADTGLNQSKLAKMVDEDAATVSVHINGRRTPGLAKRVKYARAFSTLLRRNISATEL